MTLDLEPVEVSSLFVNSLSIIREKAAARRIRLAIDDAADELGAIQADARKVKQIVYNLLSNAVKFTSEGGQVTLRARRVPRAAVGQLSGAWTGGAFPLADNEFAEFLEISVTDSGIGISPRRAGASVQTVQSDRQRPGAEIRGHGTRPGDGQAARRVARRHRRRAKAPWARAPASPCGCRCARWKRGRCRPATRPPGEPVS